MAYLSKEEKQKIKNALKIKKSLDKEVIYSCEDYW